MLLRRLAAPAAITPSFYTAARTPTYDPAAAAFAVFSRLTRATLLHAACCMLLPLLPLLPARRPRSEIKPVAQCLVNKCKGPMSGLQTCVIMNCLSFLPKNPACNTLVTCLGTIIAKVNIQVHEYYCWS